MKHKLAKVATYACLALGISLTTQAFASSEPRTLDGYVAQEDAFFDYLYKNHPIFKYEKEGRLVGKFTHSDRTENWVVNQNGAKFAAEHDLKQASITYRLPYESFLDFPNKFVGPKKCGECHPAQYASWERSRHAKTVRFPHEMEEVGGAEGLKKPMYNSQATILPDGIYPNDVYALIGTPRTKYGFIDRWLVRGTYHVEDGNLSDLSGKLTAGGNQFSRLWSEFLTPEMAQK